MSKAIKWVIFLLFFSFVAPAFAQELTLKSLIDEALKNNPQVLASHFRYEAAKAKVTLLRTIEDPTFEYEYDKITADMDAVMRGKTSPMRTFSVSQEVPFPTKLILRKKAAEKEAQSLSQDYKEMQRKIIQDVKNTFSRIFLARRKRAVVKENMHLLSQFISASKAQYSLGKAKQQDVLRLDVESAKLSNQDVLLEQEEKISVGFLNSLLGKDEAFVSLSLREEKVTDLNLDEANILELMKKNKPELKAVEAMQKKSEIDYSLAEAEYLPDFMVKYKREERNGSAGSWAGSLGVSFPLWFWEKQSAGVKEAKANFDMMKAQYLALENAAVFEVKSAYYRFEAAKKLVKTYETGILPQAKSALENIKRGYETQDASVSDLLDAMKSVREFEMEYFEALASLQVALADLERSAGTELTKEEVKIK